MTKHTHSIPNDLPSYFYNRCQEIVDILAKLYNAKTALVTQIDGNRLNVVASAGNADNEVAVGDTFAYDANLFCFRVIDSRAPLFVENPVTGDDREPTVSYFGFPLMLDNGELFGTICVMQANPEQALEKVQSAIARFRDILERELRTPDNLAN